METSRTMEGTQHIDTLCRPSMLALYMHLQRHMSVLTPDLALGLWSNSAVHIYGQISSALCHTDNSLAELLIVGL